MRAAANSPEGERRRGARGTGAAFALAGLLAAGALPAQRLPFNSFDVDDGLAGTQIWDLRQDRRGLLWVAATWGFSSFDGSRFHTLAAPQGLPSPSARTVVEDRGGTLWFGTNAGVARFDGRTVTAFAGHAEAPRGTVWASAVDGAGRLWFGGDDGLVRHADGRFTRFGGAHGLAAGSVYGLLAARDGTLWIGFRGAGLARCALDAAGEPAGCRLLTRRDGLGADVVRALAEDAAGRILVGTRGGGLSIVEGDRVSTIGVADGLPSDDVYALLVRANGVVAIGTADRGLALCRSLAPPRCRAVGVANGLPEEGVRSLLEDREGSLWVGTEGGLGRLVREDLWSYGEREGLAGRHVYALAPDGARGVWVGSFGGLTRLGVGRHGEPDAVRLDRRDGLPGRWVWALLADRRGEIWVGTEGGLCRVRGGRCVGDGLGPLASAYVLALAEDSGGDLWAAATDGVYRRRGSGAAARIERFTERDGLAHARAYAVVVDGAGRLWFAHGETLSSFDGERFRDLSAHGEAPLPAARGLGVDARGRVLVGGYGALARLVSAPDEPPRWRAWDRVAELAGRIVLTLAESEDGRLLLGTSRGVLLFDPQARGGAGAVVAELDRRSGAIASEVSHSGAFTRDALGRAWFGFKGGLTGSLGPLAASPPPPRLMISRLESKRGRVFAAAFTELAAAPVGWLESGRPLLPHDDRSMRVWVSAPTSLRRDDLRFQFRLANVDDDWGGTLDAPYLDLVDLRPGRHRLEARAAYVDGPWGDPVALEFEIRPAWWQSPLVPLAALLAGVAGVTLLVGWRARQVGRLEGELERRIAQRTEDLARYATAMAEHLQTIDEASHRARRAEQVRRDLFARASHELRTPLTAVLGFSELLERSLSGRLDDKERRYLTHVRESGELLLRQVNEVLEHFRLESGRVEVHLEEVALDVLLESVVSLMEGFALHRGVRLEVRVEAGAPAARADVAKLRQVLMNLLSNAIKFSPAGEAVTLTLRPLDAAEGPRRRAGYEISVRDRGPGVPEAELESIFEPYRRLSEPSSLPGTGLGLSIARQLVDLLGGTLDVSSRPGEGATFVVRLPAEPEPVQPLADGTDPRGVDAARAQIVVVEPDWERFGRLTGPLAADGVLAVRVERLEALAPTLGALRPRALVVPFDPAAPAAAATVEAAFAAARERGAALVLLPRREARALVLVFARVVRRDAPEDEWRVALRAAGAAPRSFGRRPLVVVAAPREAGVVIGATLTQAGCDHFRVEGAAATRAALAETMPDAGVVEPGLAFELAAESAPRAAGPGERALGWIGIDDGAPAPAAFAALAAAVEAAGGEPSALLRAAAAPLLAGAGAPRATAAAGTPPPE